MTPEIISLGQTPLFVISPLRCASGVDKLQIAKDSEFACRSNDRATMKMIDWSIFRRELYFDVQKDFARSTKTIIER